MTILQYIVITRCLEYLLQVPTVPLSFSVSVNSSYILCDIQLLISLLTLSTFNHMRFRKKRSDTENMYSTQAVNICHKIWGNKQKETIEKKKVKQKKRKARNDAPTYFRGLSWKTNVCGFRSVKENTWGMFTSVQFLSERREAYCSYFQVQLH